MDNKEYRDELGEAMVNGVLAFKDWLEGNMVCASVIDGNEILIAIDDNGVPYKKEDTISGGKWSNAFDEFSKSRHIDGRIGEAMVNGVLAFRDWLEDKIIGAVFNGNEILIAVDDNGVPCKKEDTISGGKWSNAFDEFFKSRHIDGRMLKKDEKTTPLEFDINNIDELEETAELIFGNRFGTVEMSIGDFKYLVLQHDMDKEAREQHFDLYSLDDTLGREVSFTELLDKIREDILGRSLGRSGF